MKKISIILFAALSTLFYNCNNAQAIKEHATLSAEEFATKIKQTPGAIILDVRTPEEFNGGFIADARNIDYNSSGFLTEIETLDKTKPYFVYCLSGGRSKSAANYMRNHGFREVYDMKGGTMAWTKNDLELTTTSAQKVTTDKISAEEYGRMISSNQIVLIDFYAPWCGPCKKMEPMLEDFARENEGKIKVIRLNVDENKQLVSQLGIDEIPVLKIFKNGSETWTHTGLVEKPALIEATSRL